MVTRRQVLRPFLAVMIPIAVAAQQPSNTNVSGITVSGRVCYGSSYLVRGVPVRLYTWDQSSPIRAIMRTKGGEIESSPEGGIKETRATNDFLNEVDRLAHRLPNVGMVKTDKSGRYRFSGMAPNLRYVAVYEWASEDGVNFSARATAVLKPGEQTSLDIFITTTPWNMTEGSCRNAK